MTDKIILDTKSSRGWGFAVKFSGDNTNMRQRFSIFKQVLVLVTLPLLIQLASIAWLAQLQNEAEQQLLESTRARQVSDTINSLTNHVYEMVSIYSDESSLPIPARNDPTYQSLYKKITADFAELDKLSEGDPRLKQATKATERTAGLAIQTLTELKASFDLTDKEGRDERKPMWHKLRNLIHETLDQELMYIGREKERMTFTTPAIQAALRKKAQLIMVCVAILDLVLTIVIAVFITRRISNRIDKVSDNTYRLASRLPLNAPLTGDDEIVELDQTFHKMARELQVASRKESAILENARDFIGSIDAGGSIIAANPAAEELIGVPQEELLGMHFVDLLVTEDIPKALDYLEQLQKLVSADPLDLRLRAAGGKIVDVLFSGHWSDEENSTFFVVHDMTAFRQAERLRQEVMAMVTHDLRSPLNTITNVLGFIKSGKHGQLDKRGLDYVESANRNSQRMLNLINDLLDVERIKAGMMELDLGQVSVDECLSALELSTRGLAEEAGIKIEFKSAPIVVYADEEKLDRVLTNLVSNAIKFSPRGKAVRVKVTQSAEYAIFSVEDQGTGIAPDLLPQIFDRFTRGQGNSAIPGSGLGLSICKSLVELMGGTIEVQNSKAGGAIFSFKIPLTKRRK